MSQLHMSPEQFRALGHTMVDRIASYMQSVESLPVLSSAKPGDIAAMLPDHAPDHPDDWDSILADIDSVVMPGVTHWQSPNFFGYFPANASGPAILGELLSAGLGVQGMLWSTSPACTEIETRILDWLGEMIGLPERFLSRSPASHAGGVIQGTASEAVLVAMVAARARVQALDLHITFTRLTVYASNQSHSSITKAAMISGIGRENVRLIDVDCSLALRPDALSAAIAADRAAGAVPIFACATLGTTSSTANDPLRPIAEICAREHLWLHVDAAFAGAMCICPEHRAMLDGVELADSFNFNPHKWLLTNFDCSALWVADRAALISAMSITPEYLRNSASDAGAVIDYRDWQIPLGRRFRALKLWFVIRHYGVEGLRAHIREHLRLAALFESWVKQDDRFELCAPRTSALVCFRLKGPDERNKSLLQRLNASGRLFLTHTTLPSPTNPAESRFVLRVAIGATQTQERHITAAWQLIQSESAAL